MHRVTGRIVLASIMIAGPAGAVLAPVNRAGWMGTAGFGALAVLWVVCALLAYRTIRRGDVRRHREWAVRTFALTYAAVMLRLLLGVLLTTPIAVAGVEEGLAFDRAYHIVPFLCWVPNLILAEYLIRRRARD